MRREDRERIHLGEEYLTLHETIDEEASKIATAAVAAIIIVGLFAFGVFYLWPAIKDLVA